MNQILPLSVRFHCFFASGAFLCEDQDRAGFYGQGATEAGRDGSDYAARANVQRGALPRSQTLLPIPFSVRLLSALRNPVFRSFSGLRSRAARQISGLLFNGALPCNFTIRTVNANT
jgi:hypothetical protein